MSDHRSQARARHLSKLLRETFPSGVSMGVEFGCRTGVTSEVLLEEHENLHLISVDNYLATWASSPHTQGDKDAQRQEAIDRLGRFYDRSSLWQMDALAAALVLENSQLDFAYTDVCYDHSWVRRHAAAMARTVRTGGLLVGSGGHRKKMREMLGGLFKTWSSEDTLWWVKT